jgi:two-component system cell cycle sensor histidine kinase/response regulator CckA
VGKGTGLGLSTAHGIVTQSGGRLSVSSAEGVGTTFAIHLPAAVDAIAESAAVQPEGLMPGRYGSGFVLLVDDDVAVRNVAKRILESSGYTVLVATDGPEALLLHAQHRGRLDLVVTDMIMPTMTGAVVAATLRADEPQLPVILMSGAADDATVSALEGEPVTILRKPFTPEVFLRTAADALRASSPSHA